MGDLPLIVAINAGATSSATFGGVEYQADRYSTGGSISTTTDPIGGTTDDALYQSERFGTYSYSVPVTAGTYTIQLHLAEIYWTAAGERTFNLSVEDEVELPSFDLFAEAGHDGAYNYVVEDVPVSDGALEISLEGLLDAGTLSGFAIYSADGALDTSVPEPEPNPNCSGYVGITFDDGPGSNTATLINLLKQNNLTPVTWFVMGQNVGPNSGLVSQMMSVGEVQNHSFTHAHMNQLGRDQVQSELSRTSQAIESAGAPRPTLYRPPYGEQNATSQAVATELGMRSITWDVDSNDWNGASASAIANAAGQAQNGQVILMHDNGQWQTNSAIPMIAANLAARGMCAGRIDPSTGRAVAP